MTETITRTESIQPQEAQQVLALARSSGIKMVDLRFVDLLGIWQHFTLPVQELSETLFTEGAFFDGSSVKGFQAINESDMLLIADASTAVVDPVLRIPTLSITCSVVDPFTKEPYSRDPRNIARKAEAHLARSGIATTSYFGPEAEFYIFNSLRFDQNSHSSYYFIDSDEGIWNSGAPPNGKPNLGYRARPKEGYFPVPPTDKLQDLRSEIVLRLIEAGIEVELHHHEVGSAGQAEIDLRFSTLTDMADRMMLYKYIVKNVCYQQGYTATFMPKPVFGDNGSGMHVHQSLWDENEPIFYDSDGYALLSDEARWYVGGLLAHTPALLALCAPTTNSYRRLVPGFEAPVNLVYSQRNRSACVRIPVSSNPKAKRIEYRAPDPSANPYLAFSALLMAGLDGIRNRIEPPAPMDMDLYELSAEEARNVASAPSSLGEVLNALEQDHEFLLVDDVFTPDVIEQWVTLKRERELEPMAQRPHPYEFYLYHDV